MRAVGTDVSGLDGRDRNQVDGKVLAICGIVKVAKLPERPEGF